MQKTLLFMESLPVAATRQMLEHLDSLFPLKPELIVELKQIIQYEEVKRMQVLLKPGEVSDRLYYIHKGLLHCYYEFEDRKKVKKEVSTWFMRERDTCVSVPSFYRRRPSYEYIQTLEDSELFSIGYQELESIYSRHIDFNFNARVLTSDYLVDWAEQLHGLRRLTAAEKYAALRDRDPQLLQRVPQKYLASFLGMRIETLSRFARKAN